MENEKNIIISLFEKAEEEIEGNVINENLNYDDEKVSSSTEALLNYIENKVPNEYKESLLNLVNNRQELFYDYVHESDKVYYKKGFSDAINIIIFALKK